MDGDTRQNAYKNSLPYLAFPPLNRVCSTLENCPLEISPEYGHIALTDVRELADRDNVVPINRDALEKL